MYKIIVVSTYGYSTIQLLIFTFIIKIPLGQTLAARHTVTITLGVKGIEGVASAGSV